MNTKWARVKLGEVMRRSEEIVELLPDVEYREVTVRLNRFFDGALVLSQVKGWEGAVGVCDRSLSGRLVSPEYRTFHCIAREAIPEYLAVLVKTRWFWGHLKHATRGVGARRERVRPEKFLSLIIPMPDVGRLTKGAKILEKVGAMKCLQGELLKELDTLQSSIFNQAFEGKL